MTGRSVHRSDRRSCHGSPIEETLRALGARLPAYGPVRRDLLAEARHGLEDAAEAYRRVGLNHDEATARAVADFGDVRAVAADYAELAVARAGQTAALALGPGYLLVLGAWLIDSSMPSRPVAGPHDPLVSIFPAIGVAAVLAAGVVVLGLRRGARRGRPTVRWTRLVGAAGLVCTLTTLATSYAVSPWTISLVAGHVSVHDAVELFSAVMTATILFTAARALLAARKGTRAGHADADPISYP